ncbi:MAG TPA: DUF2442 domain-containing protein [Bacteroidota bacterium]
MIEITNISSHGIWLFTEQKEFFLSFEDFPWFKNAQLKEVVAVEEPTPGHYYWPALDIDLSLESIKDPKRFPLKARS